MRMRFPPTCASPGAGLFWISLIVIAVTLLLGWSVTQAHEATGRAWLPLDEESKPGSPPQTRLVSAGTDSAVIEVHLPGIYLEERLLEGVTYTAVEIPGEDWLQSPGEPMLPEVIILVACPEFRDVQVTCSPKEGKEIADVIVWPSPRDVIKGGPQGPYLSREFCLDENMYQIESLYPGERVRILHIGRIRDQKVIWLGAHPVQFSGARQQLSIHQDLKIRLNYTDAVPSYATRGTGPFEEMCRSMVVGYEEMHPGAPMMLLGSAEPSVVWASGVQDCIDNNTDYLIIASDRFCSGPDSVTLENFAQFRADSSGYNVSIVRLGVTDSSDVALKSLITGLYESRSAAHWWDGHLGFVLLVGDFMDPDDNIVMPIYRMESSSGKEEEGVADYFAADNWFACVSDDPTYPALMLGRLPVDDSEELSNITEKVMAYEPIPDGQSWTRDIFLTYGTTPHASDFTHFNQDGNKVAAAIPQPEFTILEIRGDSLCLGYKGGECPHNLEEMNVDAMDAGKFFVHYIGHGDPCKMGWYDPRTFTTCLVESLTNTNRLCIFTSIGCRTATFDHFDECGDCTCDCAEKHDCIGERFVNSEGGAVAFIGQSDMGSGYSAYTEFYRSVFVRKSALLGMALAEMLFKQRTASETNHWPLLGDPALRLWYRDSTGGRWDLALKNHAEEDTIWFEPPISCVPVPDSSVLKACVLNLTHIPLSLEDSLPGVAVAMYMRIQGGDWDLVNTDTIRTVEAWDSVTVAIPFDVPDPLSIYDFRVVIDPDSAFVGSELHRENNEVTVTKDIGIWREGFPRVVPATPSGDPTLASLRSPVETWDDFVLFPCEDSKLYGVSGYGAVRDFKFFADDGPLHSPAVADIRGENMNLVIVASEHKVTCVDLLRASVEWLQWELVLGPDTLVLTPPCIADLAGSGDLEIAIGAEQLSDTTGLVIRIDADGNVLSPVTNLADSIPSCPLATADLNGDGNYDLVVGTSNSFLLGIDGATGERIATAQVADSTPVAGIAIGDLDWDGAQEIVAVSGRYIYVYSANTAWPLLATSGLHLTRNIPLEYGGIIIANVADDTVAPGLEMICTYVLSNGAYVEAWAYDPAEGSLWWYWGEDPVSTPGLQAIHISSPVAGDVHTCPGTETVFLTADSSGTTLWMWNADYDKTVGLLDGSGSWATAPVLADLEGDAFPEIVWASCGDNKVHAGTGTGSSRQIEWPMALGDERCCNIHSIPLADTLPSGNSRLAGRYLVEDHVWVDTGDTVTISPGTTFRFLTSETNPLSFVCMGTMVAQGREDAPIVFTPADPTPSPGDWGELWLRSGTDWTLEHAVIEYGTDGLYIAMAVGSPPCGGNVTVRSCEFRHNEAWGLAASYITAAPDIVHIEDCLFKNNGVGGIRLPYGFADIRGCTFVKDSVYYEWQFIDPIYAMKLGGTTAYGTCFTGCHIADNVLEIGEDTSPETHYWDYGLAIFGGDGGDSIIIEGNRLFPCYQGGIWIDSLTSPANIYNNCVGPGEEDYYTGFGMKFTSGGTDTAIVHDNVFLRNMYGVIATSDPFPILGDSLRTVFIPPDTTRELGYNRLWDNLYYIKSDPARTLKAEMCWWGEQVYPAGFDGDVDYEPYLGEEPAGVPEDGPHTERPVYGLMQNHPNPIIAGRARIRFSVAKESDAKVAVYNVLGQQVRVLHSGKTEAGWHEVFWDAANQAGRRVSPGVYFYRLETPAYKATKKIVVLQ